MKKILLLTILSLGLLACDRQQKPIPVLQSSPKIDTSALSEYKSHLDSRKILVGMHYGWGSNPGLSLMSTPDSLDIIVLKEEYRGLSELMAKDLKEVRSLKATKVIPSIDLQERSLASLKKITAEYRKAKLLQDVAWEEDGNKPSSDEVSKIYQALKQSVTEEEIRKARGWLEAEVKALPELWSTGYDGISIRLPEDYSIFDETSIEAALQTITAVAGLGKQYILIVESPQETFHAYIEKANYIVGYMPDENDYNSFIQQSKLYPNNRYLPAYNAKDDKLEEGYTNPPTFLAKGLSKAQALLYFKEANAAGVAVYHSETYYYDVQDINGYSNPYASLKVYINALNASSKQ